MSTYDELVKRLRDRASFVMQGPAHILRAGIEAADAIEALQRDNAALMEDAAAQIQIAREATERAAGLERDASRYRWLRRQAVSARYYASGNPNWEIDWALRGESFEAAVDAAMTPKEG